MNRFVEKYWPALMVVGAAYYYIVVWASVGGEIETGIYGLKVGFSWALKYLVPPGIVIIIINHFVLRYRERKEKEASPNHQQEEKEP